MIYQYVMLKQKADTQTLFAEFDEKQLQKLLETPFPDDQRASALYDFMSKIDSEDLKDDATVTNFLVLCSVLASPEIKSNLSIGIPNPHVLISVGDARIVNSKPQVGINVEVFNGPDEPASQAAIDSFKSRYETWYSQ